MTKRTKPDQTMEPSEIGSAMSALNIDTDVHPLYAEKDVPVRTPAPRDDPFHFQSRTVPPGLVNAAPVPVPPDPEPTVAVRSVAPPKRPRVWLVRRAARGAFVGALFVASVFVVMMALAAAGHTEHRAGVASQNAPALDVAEPDPPSPTVPAPPAAAAPIHVPPASRASVTTKSKNPTRQALPKPALIVERPQPAAEPNRRLW